MDAYLFDKGEPIPTAESEQAVDGSEVLSRPRLRVPHRDQVEMHYAALDQLLPAEHQVRIVWECICRLDLSRWLKDIKAVEGHVGRNATDPRLLLALWVYATLDGVGSARELDRLCLNSLPYQWLCGGVSVNYHLLADFRSQNANAWDEMLTQIVASLLAENLVTMRRVAQDGMRVRAHAGKSSFRTRPRLGEFLQQAREQVENLKRLADESPDEVSKRHRAARERAAAERAKRVEDAIRNCEQLQQERQASGRNGARRKKPPRASTTDPEARTMQFAHGGYAPGYNVQFSTDTASGVIVGVEVTNVGSDQRQLLPMLDQLQERYGRVPDEVLVDGGFASLEAVEQSAEKNCNVYSPLREEEKQLQAGKNPYVPKPGDHPSVAAWRQRMGTGIAKAIYRLRCQTAEWVNATCRNRGLQQLPVRGQAKCRTVALLYAITHNLLLGAKLRASQLAAS
jgi:transposase